MSKTPSAFGGRACPPGAAARPLVSRSHARPCCATASSSPPTRQARSHSFSVGSRYGEARAAGEPARVTDRRVVRDRERRHPFLTKAERLVGIGRRRARDRVGFRGRIVRALHLGLCVRAEDVVLRPGHLAPADPEAGRAVRGRDGRHLEGDATSPGWSPCKPHWPSAGGRLCGGRLQRTGVSRTAEREAGERHQQCEEQRASLRHLRPVPFQRGEQVEIKT